MGYLDLQDEITAHFGPSHPFTRLVPDLSGGLVVSHTIVDVFDINIKCYFLLVGGREMRLLCMCVYQDISVCWGQHALPVLTSL